MGKFNEFCSIAIVACIMVVAVALAACGGGSGDGGISDDRLVGLWEYSATWSTNTDVVGGTTVISGTWYFSEDGKVYAQHVVDGAVDSCLYMGTYTFEENRLIITGTSPYSGSVETLYSGAVEVQDDEMIFTDETRLDGNDWGDWTFEPSTVSPLVEGCTTLVEA